MGDSLESGRVVYVERDLHDKAAVAGCIRYLRIGRAQLYQLLIEVSGQRVYFGIGHDLSMIIRSARVEFQPVTSSQAVGSMVSSMTNVAVNLFVLVGPTRPKDQVRHKLGVL
jgi:hypothetical protein